MFEYATRSDLAAFATELNLQEQATLRKSAEDRTSVKATFLSHSSKDKGLVIGAIRILESCGARVYIDKKDPSPPLHKQNNCEETQRAHKSIEKLRSSCLGTQQRK